MADSIIMQKPRRRYWLAWIKYFNTENDDSASEAEKDAAWGQYWLAREELIDAKVSAEMNGW